MPHYPTWRNCPAARLLELAPKVLSTLGKHEINKRASDLLMIGHAPADVISRIRKQTDTATYSISDPTVVAKQRELDIVGVATAGKSQGLPEDEHLRAKADRAEAAAALVEAQAQAKHGADELETNPEQNATAEKTVTQSGDTDLQPGRKVRGESQ